MEGTRKGVCISRQVAVLGGGGERLEKASVSRRSFGAGKDGRRCGEEFAFLVRLKRKGTVRAKSERGRKRRKLPGAGGCSEQTAETHRRENTTAYTTGKQGPDARGHVLPANRKTTGAKGKLTCCVPQRREPGNRGDRQVEVEPCAWMDMRDGHGRPQAKGERLRNSRV